MGPDDTCITILQRKHTIFQLQTDSLVRESIEKIAVGVVYYRDVLPEEDWSAIGYLFSGGYRG